MGRKIENRNIDVTKARGELEEDLLEYVYRMWRQGRQITSKEYAREVNITGYEAAGLVRSLVKKGFLCEPENGHLELSDKGKLEGMECLARHEKLTQFFQMVSGMDQQRAQEDACRVEHYISPEVSDDGAYYLTIRMSLMDYTSGHSFQVQNVGDSGWSTPSEIGITGNGSDSNGTTADVCMRVPSENCIVRGEMYVEPMGRNVIFYLYPSDYSEGNNTDMNATMVTESSNGTAAESGGSGSVDNSGSTSSGNSSLGSGNSSLQSSGSSDKSSSSSSSKKLESSIKEAAKPSSDSSSLDTENPVNSSEGLSLSTAKDGTSDSDSDSGNTSSGNRIFQIALAVVVTGLILLGAVSGVIYFFRKNWKRWGGAEDDDE